MTTPITDEQAEAIAAEVYARQPVDSTEAAFQLDWELVRAGISFADQQWLSVTGWDGASKNKEMLGMSNTNRTIAYSAGYKLRSLGYEWDGKYWVEESPAIKCDCTTGISPDGSKMTICSSDQMRRAAEDGHAFHKHQPRLNQLNTTDDRPSVRSI
jgi:hypothetical protein